MTVFNIKLWSKLPKIIPVGIKRNIQLPSRFNLRIRKFGYTWFFMFSKTQSVEGITSKRPNGLHNIFFDLEKEKLSLKQVEESLRLVQIKYDLSNIYIVSDCENSYRAYCFNEVSFRKLLRIINDEELEPYLDYNFLFWTVQKGKATLRTGSKKDRPKQKLIDVLESYYIKPPTDFIEKVDYDTGDDKTMKNIFLGDRT